MFAHDARVKQIGQNRATECRRKKARNLAISRRKGTSAVKIEFSAKCPAAKRGLQPAVFLFWRDPQKVGCEVVARIKAGRTVPGVQVVGVIDIQRGRGPRGWIQLQCMAPGVKRVSLEPVV